MQKEVTVEHKHAWLKNWKAEHNRSHYMLKLERGVYIYIYKCAVCVCNYLNNLQSDEKSKQIIKNITARRSQKQAKTNVRVKCNGPVWKQKSITLKLDSCVCQKDEICSRDIDGKDWFKFIAITTYNKYIKAINRQNDLDHV